MSADSIGFGADCPSCGGPSWWNSAINNHGIPVLTITCHPCGPAPAADESVPSPRSGAWLRRAIG